MGVGDFLLTGSCTSFSKSSFWSSTHLSILDLLLIYFFLNCPSFLNPDREKQRVWPTVWREEQKFHSWLWPDFLFWYQMFRLRWEWLTWTRNFCSCSRVNKSVLGRILWSTDHDCWVTTSTAAKFSSPKWKVNISNDRMMAGITAKFSVEQIALHWYTESLVWTWVSAAFVNIISFQSKIASFYTYHNHNNAKDKLVTFCKTINNVRLVVFYVWRVYAANPSDPSNNNKHASQPPFRFLSFS